MAVPMRQFVEQARGNGISALGVGEGQKDRIVAGLALLRGVQRVEPGVELEAALFGRLSAGSSAISSQRRMKA